MRRPQIGVALDLPQPDPVVGQRLDLTYGDVASPDGSLVRTFVEVVAEEGHQVEVLLGHVGIGREEAGRVVLAAGDGEGEPVQRSTGPGRGLRPAHRADLRARTEAVEVRGARPQTRHLDVHRVRLGRLGQLGPAGHHPAELLVLGHLPLHRHRPVRHAAEPVLGQRLGRQPGPEHHPVGQRITGRHPEGERLPHHAALGGGLAPGRRVAEGRGTERGDTHGPGLQQPPPGRRPRGVSAERSDLTSISSHRASS